MIPAAQKLQNHVVQQVTAVAMAMRDLAQLKLPPYAAERLPQLEERLLEAIALLSNSSGTGEGGLSVPGVAQLDEGPTASPPDGATLSEQIREVVREAANGYDSLVFSSRTARLKDAAHQIMALLPDGALASTHGDSGQLEEGQ